ncbi:amino acid ABC transporter ATP-binding protein [Oceanirhabdus sp. W0125-5]|uniref:amino acid ABC transporter ATP-binding protein n=1 Tax=Oceanirhabdus sp. W0125-5 TaxID=2999116 RepID=UPI0022F2DC90|nr:amino acid ABC transporter ATP-binding protein [Oceanirhabdus sp. W0125-5]WBW95506.1 amino acid ABC transporter ATP-binding protein [Oceanirhabdus sp. W0125-5]
MIKIRNIQKSFGDIEVLKNIGLDVKEGEVVSIIGSSGSGKSTFLRCINYLEKADGGSIEINDKKVQLSKADKKEVSFLRNNTAMVFQSFALFNNKTAEENIMEGLISVKKISKERAREKANQLLEKVNLKDRSKHYPSQLSGGQQQRVGIARAIAMEPKLLLFDEPTSALDPELVGEVLTLIREIASENRTMLIVTHEIEFALKISDRIIYMKDGEIEVQGTPSEIMFSENESLNKFLKTFKERV